MNDLPQVVLATTNPGKVREFKALLPPGVTVLSLTDLELTGPEETGESFADNAALKATEISRVTDALVVADDSGLEVDALQGAPGVRSARYAGDPPDDQRNIDLLLEQMAEIPPALRTARFRCAVAVARRGEILLRADGTCEGSIGYQRRGTRGFGYDPIFVLPDGRTMAELSDEEKNQVSHRAVAFRAVAEPLSALIGELSNAGEPHQ